MNEAEWTARKDLAACYRPCGMFGLSDPISAHISGRIPDDPDHSLINPNARLFDEITASSLLEVTNDGVVVRSSSGSDAMRSISAALLRVSCAISR